MIFSKRSLEFKVIDQDEKIVAFLDKFSEYVGVTLNLNYAKQGTTIGLYNNGKLIGGYMIITSPNYRSLLFVPDDVKEKNEFLKTTSPQEMVEVNGLWLLPQYRAQYGGKLWTRCVRDIMKSGRQFLLLMADASNDRVRLIHDYTRPGFIYQGKPQLEAGSESHSEIIVRYTSRINLRMAPIFAIKEQAKYTLQRMRNAG